MKVNVENYFFVEMYSMTHSMLLRVALSEHDKTNR